jgi:hypothetical protein
MSIKYIADNFHGTRICATCCVLESVFTEKGGENSLKNKNNGLQQ